MTIKIKYGKGTGSNWTSSFGILEAELDKSMENLTLKQIANLLRKQAKIKDGELELHNLGFTYNNSRLEDEK